MIVLYNNTKNTMTKRVHLVLRSTEKSQPHSAADAERDELETGRKWLLRGAPNKGIIYTSARLRQVPPVIAVECTKCT